MISASRYAGLDKRVALVTGAARGLGRAVVLRLLENGASVAACDIDSEGLATLDSIPRVSGSLRIFPVDLAEAFGRLDILVNNAAILCRKPLEEMTVDDFDRVLAVNLRAPFLLARAALKDMRLQRWGRIINIASIAARTGGSSNLFAYAASKGGLVALTKALARSGAEDNILVSAVLPAGIDTPMIGEGFSADSLEKIRAEIPLQRLAQPEEIAEIVLWLASDASSYVTGASFDVNGGWAMT
jgi:3-oxoacyl-[acyl-carrier protein] reductase